jgi:phosphatidylglycerol:prolipoprotein diacylglycerol transferase
LTGRHVQEYDYLTYQLDAGIIAIRGETGLNLYALMLGIGSSLSIWRVSKEVPAREAMRWSASALIVLLGALIGARIGFVLWQPAYLEAFGWQVLRLWEGGFIWPGAIVGAWLAIFLISWQLHSRVGFVADRMSVMVPPLVIMIWLGCWMAGCGYGPLLPAGWQFPASVDETGMWASRLPLQWLAAISLFLIYFSFEHHFPRRRSGQAAALSWLLLMIHTLTFSLLRADLRPGWQGLSWDIWAAIFYLTTAVFVCLIVFYPQKSEEEKPVFGKSEN